MQSASSETAHDRIKMAHRVAVSRCFFHAEPCHEVEVRPFFVVALAMRTRFHRFEKTIDEYAGQKSERRVKY